MMLWQRRTANTIRTLLQQLKYNDVHVDLEDESGPAAEISEAKSAWEENCHGKVVCVFMLAGVEAQGQTQQQRGQVRKNALKFARVSMSMLSAIGCKSV